MKIKNTYPIVAYWEEVGLCSLQLRKAIKLSDKHFKPLHELNCNVRFTDEFNEMITSGLLELDQIEYEEIGEVFNVSKLCKEQRDKLREVKI